MTFVRFGLIVTGRGEADFLPKLFRALMGSAHCTFEVIRKSEQLSPLTSPGRILSMAGRGRRIPTIDEEQYGLPALGYLRRHSDAFVLVIDDLESTRQPQAAEVLARYRTALNEVLDGVGLSSHAAVHFLVNMPEAYYFAHAEAVNRVAGRIILSGDHDNDVEAIPHPNNQLKQVWPGFNEVEHGAMIVGELDMDHVLRSPDHCCWLRTLFAWCLDRLHHKGAIYDEQIYEGFRLRDGCRVELTRHQ